jgi:hypothetical protein
MKYYIYQNTSKKKGYDPNRLLYFVPDPELFANSGYNPLLMEFANIAIEAEDLEHAKRIYDAPWQHDDKIVSCEEPEATIIKRQKLQDIVADKNNMMLVTISAGLNALIYEIDAMFKKMARIIARKGKISEAEAYELVKKTFLKSFDK